MIWCFVPVGLLVVCVGLIGYLGWLLPGDGARQRRGYRDVEDGERLR